MILRYARKRICVNMTEKKLIREAINCDLDSGKKRLFQAEIEADEHEKDREIEAKMKTEPKREEKKMPNAQKNLAKICNAFFMFIIVIYVKE